MKKKNNTKKYLNYILSMISFFILFILIQCFAVYADTNLNLGEKRQYYIQSSDDFIEFVSNPVYKNATAVLKNDITVSNMPQLSSEIFEGVFDGSGKTIHFVENNYRKNESLFPWYLKGTIKNVNIDVQAKLVASIVGNDVNILNRRITGGILQGVSVSGNVTCVFDKFDFNLGEDLKVSACDSFSNDILTGRNCEVDDCEFSLNYILGSESDSNLVNDIISNCLFIELYQIGGRQSENINLKNCFSKASLDQSFIDLYNSIKDQSLDEFLQSGLYVQFLSGSKSNFTNYYYDKDKSPSIEAINNTAKDLLESKNVKPADYDSAGKTTDEMKQQKTYSGFDFEKKWSISADENDGYPYYNPKTETITLEVQAKVEPKVWHTDVARDFNRFKDTSKNYHFPYRVEKINETATNIYDDGDNNVVTVTGAKFTNLTAEQQELVNKYEITAVLPSGDPSIDVKSAIINTDFLGERPLTVEWNNEPILQFADGKEAEAESDGYTFKVKVVDGTGQVIDNGEKGASSDPANWESYYQKAKKANNIIMKYCEDKDSFGPKDSPSYNNTDIWAIFTAARCNYVPYGDSTYFDRWFVNTKEYLQSLKDKGTDVAQWRTTELSKLILAIEAIGYDPRDISSVDLLSAVGERKSTDLTYTTVYAINAIKSGGYTADTFTDAEMDQWAHDTAAALLNAEDRSLANADNTMGWQPLIFWYNKPGFEDVKKAVDAAEKRLPAIAQRATGSFCTAGFETGCASYGNNAWNDAQAMLFAGTFGVNVLDSSSGYTKNGNNILDAFFDLVDVDGVLDGSIHGFTNYDVPQIARGLDAFIRQYENTASFWEFTDVKVPTKSVNDMILTLNDNSTKEEIEAARNDYNALDEKHKAIFNKDTLRKLLAAENGKGDSITKVIAAIDALPAADKLTLEDKDAVVKARNLYDALDDEAKSVISNYSKLTEAEARIKELEKGQTQKEKDKAAAEKVVAAINALPSSDALTLDPYVLQLLDRVQAEYNALTDAQKALVTNYSTLQYLRNLIPDLKAAAAVVDKIKAIGEVTSDNYLKKQALVVEARTAYDALTADQKKRVTNYAELEKAELFISRQSTDEKVAYVISFIDELNITTSSSGALSDGPLRLTEKNNNVPTEKIWNDWKAYVVNARALYDTLDDQQKAQVTNTASLEKAEGYIYQLKADALKAMLKALPDAQTVRGYEAPQPTTVPSAQEAASVEEEQAVPAQSEGSDFSDGSADAFSSDEVDEQAAETVDIPQAESAEDTEDVQTDVDFSSDEEVPAAGDTSKRELTEAELKQIAEAKNAYDRLTETEEKKFRSENTALVENMEKLLAMALTYEKGQSAYQQFFADEAAQIYATVKDHPVDRDSYADVKAFLDRYAKDYQGQEDAMAGLKVKVGSQEMTFAEVIAADGTG